MIFRQVKKQLYDRIINKIDKFRSIGVKGSVLYFNNLKFTTNSFIEKNGRRCPEKSGQPLPCEFDLSDFSQWASYQQI
jgi:hypothetical protein